MEDNDDYFYNALLKGYLLGKADNQNAPTPVAPAPDLIEKYKKRISRLRAIRLFTFNNYQIDARPDVGPRRYSYFLTLLGGCTNVILVSVYGKKELELGLSGYYLFLSNETGPTGHPGPYFPGNIQEFFNELNLITVDKGINYVKQINPSFFFSAFHMTDSTDRIEYINKDGSVMDLKLNAPLSLNLSFKSTFKAYNVSDELYKLGKQYRAYAIFSVVDTVQNYLNSYTWFAGGTILENLPYYIFNGVIPAERIFISWKVLLVLNMMWNTDHFFLLTDSD